MEYAYTTNKLGNSNLVFVSTKEAKRLYESGSLELSKHRLKKAEDKNEEQSKLQSVAASLALSKGLELFAGLDERAVTIETGRFGKPKLSLKEENDYKMAPMSFNLSHSGEFGVAAFSQMEVGVDLQRLTVVNHRLAERICNDAEREWLNSAEEDFERRLLCIFSAKEAILKAIGIGLGGMGYDYEWNLEALMNGKGCSFVKVKCTKPLPENMQGLFDKNGECTCNVYRLADGIPTGYVCFLCECTRIS